MGGGNGTFLINMVPKVMPGGKYFGTGADDVEVTAMRDAAAKAGFADAVSVQVAGELTSGLPAGCCDAIVLRMVYHMLKQPKEYLADFKRALKPNGKVRAPLAAAALPWDTRAHAGSRLLRRLLDHPTPYTRASCLFRPRATSPQQLVILEHNPDNGKTTRDGAVLQVSMMGGKVMGMPVVPQEAMVEEAEAAGFAMAQPDPFGWPYFTGPHYVNGPDGRGYGVLLMKPEDVSPPPSPVKKAFCNCACGGSGQCGVACSSCDCEGCAPAPSPPPPPKPLCNCKHRRRLLTSTLHARPHPAPLLA